MAEAQLACYTRREDRSPVLVLEGCLDLATAPQALDAMRQFVTEHGPEVVVDTSRLDFIDSKGVGALLGASKAARDAGGQLYLHQPALPVRKILETCGLLPLFPSRPSPTRSEPANGTAAPEPARAEAPRPRTRKSV